MRKEINVQPIRSREQLEDMKWALRRHCSERDYIMFLLATETGLRMCDVLRLKTAHILSLKRSREKTVKLTESKTKKDRYLYIDHIYHEVYEYAKDVNSDWLFPSRKGDRAISTTQAYRILNKAADFAGIDNVGNHTCRKTFGYWFYKQTKDVVMLKRILNHRDTHETLRYIGITDEETQNALKNFSVFN